MDALFNLLMSEVLRKFREENGHGPSTEELLELRSAVATKLGIELPSVPNVPEDKKRVPDDDTLGLSPKKVKFSNESKEEAYDDADAAIEAEDVKE
jgi:hypothetical protein